MRRIRDDDYDDDDNDMMMMMMMMISHTHEETRCRSQLTLVCCQNEEIGPAADNLEGKEYFIERMKQRSKNVLMQRAIAAKIW